MTFKMELLHMAWVLQVEAIVETAVEAEVDFT
jgi:hypothetical protein